MYFIIFFCKLYIWDMGHKKAVTPVTDCVSDWVKDNNFIMGPLKNLIIYMIPYRILGDVLLANKFKWCVLDLMKAFVIPTKNAVFHFSQVSSLFPHVYQLLLLWPLIRLWVDRYSQAWFVVYINSNLFFKMRIIIQVIF